LFGNNDLTEKAGVYISRLPYLKGQMENTKFKKYRCECFEGHIISGLLQLDADQARRRKSQLKIINKRDGVFEVVKPPVRFKCGSIFGYSRNLKGDKNFVCIDDMKPEPAKDEPPKKLNFDFEPKQKSKPPKAQKKAKIKR